MGAIVPTDKEIIEEQARRIADLEAGLRLIADGEPPDEEKMCGTVDVWMREVARRTLQSR